MQDCHGNSSMQQQECFHDQIRIKLKGETSEHSFVLVAVNTLVIGLRNTKVCSSGE